GVMCAVSGGGDGVEDLREVGQAADFLEQLALGEFFAKDHAVDGTILLVKLDDDVENDLVVGLIEGLAIDDLHDLTNHVLVEHHGRQQAALGVDGAGGKSIKLSGEGIG